jgi:hypothetical protein
MFLFGDGNSDGEVVEGSGSGSGSCGSGQGRRLTTADTAAAMTCRDEVALIAVDLWTRL